ncbi:MAG: hypothetical protein H7321_08270, partial [Bacteroidia bacterium]|nr:hypothetical protein [Bacteroidia bacterium]
MLRTNFRKKNLITATTYTVLFTYCLLAFQGCKEANKLDVDIDDIELKLEILRFEEDMFAMQGIDTIKEAGALRQKYGPFYYDYIGGIMGWGNPDTKEAVDRMFYYKGSDPAKRVFKISEGIYKDFTPYEKEITDAFKHFKYYFPKAPIPKIITFQSQFSNYIDPSGDGYTAIALDMHLGDTFKPYSFTQPEPVPDYLLKILTPKHVAIHAIRSHGNSLFGEANLNRNFADNMILWGKTLYFLDAMMPKTEDYLKIGYSPAELKWAKDNEKEIWELFVKDKWLYNTVSMEYSRFFNE